MRPLPSSLSNVVVFHDDDDDHNGDDQVERLEEELHRQHERYRKAEADYSAMLQVGRQAGRQLC